MAEQTDRRRKAPLSPLRILAALLGLVMAAVGGMLLWNTSRKATSQTPVLTIALRAETPAASGPAKFRMVGTSESPKEGDVTLTIAFDTRSVGNDVRLVRRQRLPDKQIKAEVLSEPGHPQLATDPARVLAMQHLDRLADEVEHRTGDPLYARATRNMGEWVSIEGGPNRWAAWAMFIVGVFVVLISLPLRRYGLWRRNQ